MEANAIKPELRCPHCGNVAMSYLTKSMVGPARSVPCRACGRAVSVPWLAVAAVVPLVLGMCAAMEFWPAPVSWVFPVVGFGITAAVHTSWVPLASRGA